MIYGGWLLEINSILEYPRMPDATRQFYLSLQFGGVALLPGLLIHLHVVYMRTIARFGISRWADLLAGVFYALPILGSAGAGVYAVRHGSPFEFLDVITGTGLFAAFLLFPALIVSAGADFAISKRAEDSRERSFFGFAWGSLGSGVRYTLNRFH